MPELPEIRRYSQQINDRLSTLKFNKVEIMSPPYLAPFNDTLPSKGDFYISSKARGKELLLHITSVEGENRMRTTCWTHGLVGKWIVYDKTYEKPPPYIHLQFTGNHNILLCYCDSNKMGKFRDCEGFGSNHDFSTNRGPDPLTENIPFLTNILSNTNSKEFQVDICELMLNQKYFNGIGNYLRAEILYRAGISPFTEARKIFQETVIIHNPLTYDCLSADNIDKDTDKGLLIFYLCKAIPNEILELGLNKYGNESEVKKFQDWLRIYSKGEEKKVKGRSVHYSPSQSTFPPDIPRSINNYNVHNNTNNPNISNQEIPSSTSFHKAQQPNSEAHLFHQLVKNFQLLPTQNKSLQPTQQQLQQLQQQQSHLQQLISQQFLDTTLPQALTLTNNHHRDLQKELAQAPFQKLSFYNNPNFPPHFQDSKFNEFTLMAALLYTIKDLSFSKQELDLLKMHALAYNTNLYGAFQLYLQLNNSNSFFQSCRSIIDHENNPDKVYEYYRDFHSINNASTKNLSSIPSLPFVSSEPHHLHGLTEISWKKALEVEMNQPYFREIMRFLDSERATKTIYPPKDEVFAAFNMTPVDKIKVVIIGQDPYFNEDQANGLCFSVKKNIKVPPSLTRIFSVMQDQLSDFRYPNHGSLERWARNGVLLLNATLTVVSGLANSHANCGWQTFTDSVIKIINDNTDGVVFMLWGNFAQKKGARIDKFKHHVLEHSHPSPLSGNQWNSCKHFVECNTILRKLGKEPIDWNLDD